MATNQFGDTIETDVNEFGDPISRDRLRTIEGSIAQFGSGFNEGLATTLGLPVDIVNAGLSYVGLGSDEPVGGSQSLINLIEDIQAPKDPLYAPERRVGQVIGETAPFGLATGVKALAAPIRAAIPTTTGQAVGQTLLRPAVEKPLATGIAETAAAAGAGVGAAVAQEVAPGSVGADIGAQIVGGIAPALAPTTLAARGFRTLADKMSPKAQAQRTREQLSEMMGEELTAQTGQRIVEGEQVAAQIPGLEPSLAEVSGSPAFINAQRIREQSLGGQKLEEAVARYDSNKAAVNDFISEAAPEAMDVDVIIGRAGQNVDRLVTEVEAAKQVGGVPVANVNKSEIGAAIREDLIARRQAASEAATESLNELGLSEIDITPQYDTIREDLIETMTPTGRFSQQIDTPDVVGILKDDRAINLPTSIDDLKQLREFMSADVRALTAGSAPDLKKARYLKMGLAKLDAAMEAIDLGDATDTYRAWRQSYFENVIEKFGKGAASKVRQKGRNNFYVTDDEKIAHTFFGPNKETDMGQFVEIFGNSPKQMDAMKSVIVDDFVKATVREGEIKPKLMDNWLARFGGTLDQVPVIRDELLNATTAQKMVNTRNASLDGRLKQIEDAVLTKKLRQFSGGAKTGDQVIDDALKSPRMMNQLLNRLRGDEEAIAGLQRHVWDSIVGDSAKVTLKNLDANRDVLKKVLTPKHLDNIETVIKAQEMIERVPVPTGGGDLSIGGVVGKAEELMGAGIPQIASRAFAVESGRTSSRFVLTELTGRALRAASNREAKRIMDEALYNPQVAKDLADMIKFPKSEPVKNRMKKHIFTLGIEVEDEE